MLPTIFVYKEKEMNQEIIALFSTENTIPTEQHFHLMPEKRQLSIEQIRLLKKQLMTTSGQRRLFVLHDFDIASPPAQNALLKTLEEKRESDYFLLLVNQVERVLTTIRSRCTIRFSENYYVHESSEEMADIINILIKGTGVSVLSHPRVTGMTQEKALLFLDEFIISLREKITIMPWKTVPLLKNALKAKSLLQSNNLNPQLAIDTLLLKALDNGKKETR